MKNSYLAFIQANDALAKCMAAQKADQWQAMSAADQSNVCKAEATTVADMLKNDNISFRNLLAERMEALKAQKQ